MPRTVAEIITELNEHEDKDAAIAALQNDQSDVIKKFRNKVFAAGEREGKKAGGKAAEQVETLQARVQELEGENEELKKKAPDLAAKTKELEDKHKAKVEELKGEIRKRDERLAARARETGLGQFKKLLTGRSAELAKVHQGLELGDVDEDYAEIILARNADRIVVGEDGQIKDVLKPGEQTGYEADSIDAKLALLAADARKKVPDKFITVNGDSGAGIGAGTGGSRGGQRQTTPEQLRDQKRRQIASAGIM